MVGTVGVAVVANDRKKLDTPLPDANVAAEFYMRYEIREFLGDGVTSTVRRCIEKASGAQYAVKICEASDLDLYRVQETDQNTPTASLDDDIQLTMIKEVEMLRVCSGHPNIIELHDTFINQSCIFLVLELCRRGELFDYLNSVVLLPESRTRILMRQVLEAIEFIHSRGIVHRDIKLENILLDETLSAKLSDFGFAVYVRHDEQLKEIRGTPGYLAPEMLRANMYEDSPGYGRPVDMWCCGVMLYTLLCGSQPFSRTSREETIVASLRGQYTFEAPEWQDISDAAKDMITRLLTQNPKDRMTASEALRHPFIHQPSFSFEIINHIPSRRFKTAALAVVGANRFDLCRRKSSPSELPRERLEKDPYSVRDCRRAIDAGAFRIYHHWVKKTDCQNRGALFETEPRRDRKRAMLKAANSPTSPSARSPTLPATQSQR